MGRLAGFRYREVARKLRAFGYLFDRQGLVATKCGATLSPATKLRFPTMRAISPKARCAQSSAKPASTSTVS
jgi:hypothetical protein